MFTYIAIGLTYVIVSVTSKGAIPAIQEAREKNPQLSGVGFWPAFAGVSLVVGALWPIMIPIRIARRILGK